MELHFKGDRLTSTSTNSHLYADWFIASNDGLYSEPPEKRCWHTLTPIDETAAILFGGKGLRGMLNDVYFLDIGKQFFYSSSSPSPFRNHHLNQKRTASGTWKKVETKGTPPRPRYQHTANVVDHTLYIIGGSTGKQLLSDVFTLNLGIYRRLLPSTVHSLLMFRQLQKRLSGANQP